VIHNLDDLYRNICIHGSCRTDRQNRDPDQTLEDAGLVKGKDKSLIIIDEPAREAGNRDAQSRKQPMELSPKNLPDYAYSSVDDAQFLDGDRLYQ